MGSLAWTAIVIWGRWRRGWLTGVPREILRAGSGCVGHFVTSYHRIHRMSIPCPAHNATFVNTQSAFDGDGNSSRRWMALAAQEVTSDTTPESYVTL